MNRGEARQVYLVIRKIDAKTTGSDLRWKMVNNTRETKKAQTDMDELVKDLQENMTDEEKRATEVEEQYKQKCRSRYEEPSAEEREAMEKSKEWWKMFRQATKKLDDEAIELKIEKVKRADLDKLADNNDLTMDEMAILEEHLLE